jgi:hypothetical protein
MQVIPVEEGWWDWGVFLEQAKPLLSYAFERSDAEEKWASGPGRSRAMGQLLLR